MTAKEHRINFYGKNDSRAFDEDETELMESYFKARVNKTFEKLMDGSEGFEQCLYKDIQQKLLED